MSPNTRSEGETIEELKADMIQASTLASLGIGNNRKHIGWL